MELNSYFLLFKVCVNIWCRLKFYMYAQMHNIHVHKKYVPLHTVLIYELYVKHLHLLLWIFRVFKTMKWMHYFWYLKCHRASLKFVFTTVVGIFPGKKKILKINRHYSYYLKVCELRMIKIWIYMKSGSNYEQQLEFVERWANISSKSQTPYLQKCFQIKKYRKSHLEEQRDSEIVI